MPLLSALMADRVTNLCKASIGEWYSQREHDFSSHDDFERGRRREMSSLKNERGQSLPRETAPQPTTHVHLRSVACHRITKNAPYAWGNFRACAITRFQKPQQLSWAGRGQRARRSTLAQWALDRDPISAASAVANCG